jgi:hypothetical protein
MPGCITEKIKPDRGITYTYQSISIPTQDALASLWSIHISIQLADASYKTVQSLIMVTGRQYSNVLRFLHGIRPRQLKSGN